MKELKKLMAAADGSRAEGGTTGDSRVAGCMGAVVGTGCGKAQEYQGCGMYRSSGSYRNCRNYRSWRRYGAL